MRSAKIKNSVRLIKNLLALAIIIVGIFLIWRYFVKESTSEFQIENTPIQIQSIKAIAEISTVSYQDQVVVDSVEFYKGAVNLYNPLDWQRIIQRNIKRRLTLIVEGEVRYGIDLTEKNFSQKSNLDTIWLTLPEPVMLDILVAPSKTEVFQESGLWREGDRILLELKGKEMIRKNAEELKLNNVAQKNCTRLFNKLVPEGKILIINYE